MGRCVYVCVWMSVYVSVCLWGGVVARSPTHSLTWWQRHSIVYEIGALLRMHTDTPNARLDVHTPHELNELCECVCVLGSVCVLCALAAANTGVFV